MAKPWGGPGAWAADAEQAEAEAKAKGSTSLPPEQFPSLGDANAAKPKKKNKGTTLSLSELTTGKYVGHGGRNRQISESTRLTTEEMMLLPTAPRERTDEDVGGIGRGFRDYGARGGGGGTGFGDRSGSDREPRDRSFGGGFDRESKDDRRGMGPTRDPRDDGPSRADEADNWGASKKATLPSYVGSGGGGGGRGGGGYDDHDRIDRRISDRDLPSRADEDENWGTNKKVVPLPADGYGERRGGRGVGFEDRRSGGGFDDVLGGISRADEVSNWGAAKKAIPTPAPLERRGGGGFDSYSRDGGSDSDRWVRKPDAPQREDLVRPAERPRLVLQPRTIPVEPTLPVPLHIERNGENERPHSSHSTRSDRSVALSENSLMSDTSAPRKPRSNPFGSARPREEVLAEKGQDYRKIDAELDLKAEKYSRPSSSHSSRSSRPQTPEVGVGEGQHKSRPRVSPFGEARPRERDTNHEDRGSRDWRKFEVDLTDRPGREQVKAAPEDSNVQMVS